MSVTSLFSACNHSGNILLRVRSCANALQVCVAKDATAMGLVLAEIGSICHMYVPNVGEGEKEVPERSRVKQSEAKSEVHLLQSPYEMYSKQDQEK